MKPVIVESPFAGDVERNLAYVREAMADCLRRGEAPFASHALYTQPGVLDDSIPGQRALGIAAGFAWRAIAEYTVFYVDYGWSSGMLAGLKHCQDHGSSYVTRMLHGGFEDEPTEPCLRLVA